MMSNAWTNTEKHILCIYNEVIGILVLENSIHVTQVTLLHDFLCTLTLFFEIAFKF